MPSEQVFFHKGLSFHARSALQEGGFLQTSQNVVFEVDGKTVLRPKFTARNETAVNAIHSLRRFKSKVFIGDADRTRHWNGTAVTDMAPGFCSGSKWSFVEVKNFLFGTNGMEQILFDENGYLYRGRIENPTAPTGAIGASGNPSGHYMLYVSFLITWPNGMQYETGLSEASADVNATSDIIEWSNIPVSTYVSYYGNAPTIHRKLYRGPGTGGAIADIYYVDTIEDNTTTTYSDDFTDEELAANGASTVDDLIPGPDASYCAFGYGRLFLIEKASPNRLWYSEAAGGETAEENEALMPLGFTSDNWDDLREIGVGEIDPQGLVFWGMSVWIPLKHTWIRKQGNDPDTWSYKRTWAGYGISAPDTIAISGTPLGIIGLSLAAGGECGLTLFNGQESTMFTSPRFDYIFKEHLDQTYIANCCGRIVGKYYHLLYPSINATGGVPDTHIVFDLRRWPDIRMSNWTSLSGQCLEASLQGSNFYIGGSDGYLREQDASSAETIDVIIKTHDLVGNDPKLVNMTKKLREIKYNMDSGGTALELAVYIDGTVLKWPDNSTHQDVSGTAEGVTPLRSLPQNAEGYRYALQLTGTGLTELAIYSPWELVFDPKP
jgi:hypothetical protein